MSVWGLSLCLTDLLLSHTNQYKLLCAENRAAYDVTEVEQVPLGWLRTIYYNGNHRERWCGGLWSSSRPQISVPAFSLCHFTKMWVSLVNTLNPRPNEHIMAFCSVGNRLHLKREWVRRARLYIICAPQSEGLAVELFGCRNNTLAVSLTKLEHLLHLKATLGKWNILSFKIETPPVTVLQEGLVIISHLWQGKWGQSTNESSCWLSLE